MIIDYGNNDDIDKNGCFDVPGALTNIGANAFNDSHNLTSIILPEGITFIGDCAFRGCSSLEDNIIDRDENESEIVKELLPATTQDKVISKSHFGEVLLAQKEAIIEFATTHQFSSHYKWRAYFKVMFLLEIFHKSIGYHHHYPLN
jgi:hypothetical protein